MATEGPLSFMCLWESNRSDKAAAATTYDFGCCNVLGVAAHGLRLHLCERVPLCDATRIETYVRGRLCALTRSRPGQGAGFAADPLELAEAIHEALRVFRYDQLLAAETRRCTRLEPCEYEALIGRFLTEREGFHKGWSVPLEDLKSSFKTWQEQTEGGRQVPLLHEQFFKVCHDFNAATYESVTVRFLDEEKGEYSMLDATMY